MLYIEFHGVSHLFPNNMEILMMWHYLPLMRWLDNRSGKAHSVRCSLLGAAVRKKVIKEFKDAEI